VIDALDLLQGSQDSSVFSACGHFDATRHVVVMTGELDMCSRASATRSCTAVDYVDVVVDLAGLAFMDCAGYSALTKAKAILGSRGGSLVLSGAVGEPLRLLMLLQQADPLGRRWD
jgi:anti-anti-sigma factor